MSAWESFWRSVHRAALPGSVQRRIAALEARRDELESDLAAVQGQRDAAAVQCLELAARNAELRQLFAEQQHRNNVVLQGRLEEMRGEKEYLERVVARSQGLSTDQDWTGSTTLATRPT